MTFSHSLTLLRNFALRDSESNALEDNARKQLFLKLLMLLWLLLLLLLTDVLLQQPKYIYLHVAASIPSHSASRLMQLLFAAVAEARWLLGSK